MIEISTLIINTQGHNTHVRAVFKGTSEKYVRKWSTSNIVVVWMGCHRQYSHNRANIYMLIWRSYVFHYYSRLITEEADFWTFLWRVLTQCQDTKHWVIISKQQSYDVVLSYFLYDDSNTAFPFSWHCSQCQLTSKPVYNLCFSRIVYRSAYRAAVWVFM